MVDHTPGAGDPEPGGAQPDAGTGGPPAESGGRFPDLAPEESPDVRSTDWSGSPVPSEETPAPSGAPAPNGEASQPAPAQAAPAASEVPPIAAPPTDPGAQAPPVAWAPAAPSAPLVWGAAATPPPPPVAWQVAAPVKREIAPGLVFASTGRRFVAYLIDSILALLLTWLVEIPLVLITPSGSSFATIISAISFAGVALVYFIVGWRSRARATPGMRMLKLQIGNAFDGQTLTIDQAFRRWVVMGYPLYLLWLVPSLAGLGGLATFGLWIALLLTTIASQTKQGLHDRVANSAVVEPIGAGNGAVVGCVVVVVLVFVVLPIVSIVALVFLGGQVSSILSTVGSPAP